MKTMSSSDGYRHEKKNPSRRSVPLPINRFGLRKWNALGRYSMSFCRKQIGEMCLPYLYL